MVTDVINTTKKNLTQNSPRSIIDIYNYPGLIVNFSKKMKLIDSKIKNFLKYNMYNHKKVLTNTNKGKIIIKDLFKYLLKYPKKHIKTELFKNENKERVIADFIAGMTDRNAINLYKTNKIEFTFRLSEKDI